MRDYRKSNYAINKVRKGIVYRNADGSILELTFEKIAAENPEFTAEDFEKLKKLSDELYHDEEKSDNLQANYVKSLFDENDVIDTYAVPSCEDAMLNKYDSEYLTARIEKALSSLTQTQRRRVIMAYIQGLSACEIARMEGIRQQSVSESLNAAKKKIQEFFKKF